MYQRKCEGKNIKKYLHSNDPENLTMFNDRNVSDLQLKHNLSAAPGGIGWRAENHLNHIAI